MTDEMTMVQWADLTGRGFSRHEEGPPVAREFWAAAEHLVDTGLGQPPENIRSTLGSPVWTLRRVAVAGRGPVWCFVVQGRRGPFGVAGTARFAFAPPGLLAAEAWQRGRDTAAAEHLPGTGQRDEARFAALVGDVLGGLLAGQAAVPITGSPDEAAVVVPAVLGVLPERTAREWTWSTCLLQNPGPECPRMVAGRWPGDFAEWEPNRARIVAGLFSRGPVPRERVEELLAHPEAAGGFDRLAARAAEGRGLPPKQRLAPRDLRDLIVEIGQDQAPPAVADVPAMLETPAGRNRLRDHYAPLVLEWACEEPAEAVRRLRTGRYADLHAPLLDGALAAQAVEGRNLLDLPTAADGSEVPTVWQHTLARLMRERYPDVVDRASAVRVWIETPGGVLSRGEDLRAAGDWLCLAGFTRASHPAFFPPCARTVVRELNRHHAVTGAAAAELSRARDPLALITELLPELDPLPADAAARLLGAATRDGVPPDRLGRLCEVTHALIFRGLGRCAPGVRERWVLDLLDAVSRVLDAEVAREVAAVALEVVEESYPEAVTMTPPVSHRTGRRGPDRRRTVQRYAVACAICAVLGVLTGAFVMRATGGEDRAEPRSPSPATSSETPPGLAEAEFTLNAAGKDPVRQAEADAAGALTRLHPDQPVRVVVVHYAKDGRVRAEHLRDRLAREVVLRHAEVLAVPDGDAMTAPSGTLRVTVYSGR